LFDELKIDFFSFLFSHKRSTGQGIAGRLFEGLKDHYKVFLDSEAKFKIHNLRQIVEQTAFFVFILTHGILLSKWCLEELKSAVQHKKKVLLLFLFVFFKVIDFGFCCFSDCNCS
jgi:hypothetical protein